MSVNFDEEEAIGTSPIPATSLNHVENNVGSCVKGPFTSTDDKSPPLGGDHWLRIWIPGFLPCLLAKLLLKPCPLAELLLKPCFWQNSCYTLPTGELLLKPCLLAEQLLKPCLLAELLFKPWFDPYVLCRTIVNMHTFRGFTLYFSAFLYCCRFCLAY